MLAPHRHLVSEEEFLALPESMDRVELVDGEVYVSPAPSLFHQEVLGRLVFALRAWAQRQESPVLVGQSPLDVRFAPGRILQPDAFVVLGHVPLDTKGPLDRVPELCIEVVSNDRRHDRVTKRLIYAAAGVQEYWVVDPVGIVERWTGAELRDALELTDTVTTPLLPGLSIDVAALFQG